MRRPLALGLVGSAIAGAGAVASPDPAPQAESPPAGPVDGLDNAGCVRCHADVAEQWRGSPHQTAFVESTFQVAIAIEPRAYCRACHAPLADPSHAEVTPPAELGVACVSCHVRDGVILAGSLAGVRATPAAVAPHSVVRDGTLTSIASCGACHEFDFPDTALRDHPLAMQRTVSEHAASRFADDTCVSCHMPRLDGQRASHRFAASRDPDLLRDAVRIAAERTGPSTLRITLRPGRVGHAFPTGDLLRRLEVGAAAIGPQGDGKAQRRYLARHLGDRVQRNGIRLRDEFADDRVPPDGARVVDLQLSDAPDRPVRWWVHYQRVAHQRTADPREALVDGSVVLAQGTLAPPPG